MRLRTSATALQDACVIVIFAWLLIPQLAYSTAARLAAFAAAGLWILLELTRSRGLLRSVSLPVMLLVIFVAYTVLFEFLTHGVSGIVSRIQTYIMLFFLLVQQSRRRSPQSLQPLLWAALCLNAVATTTTFLFLMTTNARAMRTVVRSTEEARDLVEQGVGGFALAYLAVLVLPLLLGLSLRPSLIADLNPPAYLRIFRRLPVMLIWYLTALSMAVIVMSQFATAVLIMGVCVGAVLMLWRFSPLRLLAVIALSALLLIFGEMLFTQILLLLQPYAEGTNYALKIRDLLTAMQLDSAVGTVEGRQERYLRSLALFWENPLTGVLYFTDVGKHSSILDAFARWGAGIGGIFLYLVSFIQFRAMRKLRPSRGGFGTAFGALVATLLMFTLNNHFMAAGIALYILAPTVLSAFERAMAARQPENVDAVHA